MSNEWLQKLKPGDKVILDGHLRGKDVVEVTRVTPATVHAHGLKFRKKDGFSIPIDAWVTSFITPFTQKDADAIRLREQQQRVYQIDATKLTAEQCDAILAIAYPKEKDQ